MEYHCFSKKPNKFNMPALSAEQSNKQLSIKCKTYAGQQVCVHKYLQLKFCCFCSIAASSKNCANLCYFKS